MAGRPHAPRRAPPTSRDLNDFRKELEHAGDRQRVLARVQTLKAELAKKLAPADFEFVEVTGRAAKKNLAQRFSEAIAQKIANALRHDFPEIQPDADGGGHESFSRGAHGLKKLDVNYSTKKSGLELAVSVKTINFPDEATGRYTKNVKRVDGELRAEAQDCHGRQPFAVIAAYLFMPAEAAEDGARSGSSSASHAAKVLEARSGRQGKNDPEERVELAFVGLYDQGGRATFYSPGALPENGREAKTMTFAETLDIIRKAHRDRNRR